MSRKNNGCVETAFLIVVRDVVVGQDLAQTITDDRPQARVIISPSLEEAVTALSDVSAVEMAFVAADPGVFEHSALADGIAARGGKVVLLGLWEDRPPPRAVRWTALPFPFTTADVRGLIVAG